jgi:hypothetical protein
VIAAFKHLIRAPRGHEISAVAVFADQEARGSPDVAVQYHSVSLCESAHMPVGILCLIDTRASDTGTTATREHKNQGNKGQHLRHSTGKNTEGCARWLALNFCRFRTAEKSLG